MNDFALTLWVLLGALAMLQPFLIPRPARPPEPTAAAQRRAGLARRKHSLYREIRDLELDQATGKLSAEDYRQQRDLLVRSAAEVVRELDHLTPKPEPAPVSAPQPERGARAEARYCTACGTRRGPDDRFCRHCGKALH